MNTFLEENKRPLLYAAGLHIMLLIIVCVNWQFLPKESGVNLDAPPVVNAVMMEQATPAAKPEPIKPLVEPQTPPSQPVEQTKTITKPEPVKTTVKPIEDPQAIPLVKPKTKPVPKKHDEDLMRQLDLEQKEQQRQKQNQQQKQLEQQFQQQLAKDAPVASKNSTSVATNTNVASTNAPSMSSAEIDQYKSQIIAAISQQWIVPPNATDKFCKFLIRLAPGGVVLDVKLLQSSGNEALDRSARAAVFKASPLPVPSDNALFDAFRELNLTVHPKDS